MTNEVLQKTTSNEQNVSSSNGLEPPLRFGDFTGSWKKSILSSLFKKCLEKNKNGLINNVICNSAKNGLMPQRDFFDKDIANAENTNGYYIIQENDFVYNPRKSNEAPYGPISIYKHKEKGIVSPLYLCFRATQEINPRYFEMYFKSSVWHKYIYFAGDSGARHDRVSIKDDVFFEMLIKLPSLSEQQKIANFLSLVDQRIEKQRQLVESLKKYKRGLLLKVFAGKKSNELLINLISIGKAGGTPLSSKSEYYNGDIPFLSISDMTSQGKYIKNTEKKITDLGLRSSSAWLVPDKSLIISMYASYGLVAINLLPLATSQAMYCMVPKKETDTEYLYYYLSFLAQTGYYEKMVSTGTQPNLNAEKIKNIPIYNTDENSKSTIAKTFQLFDTHLTMETQKLEGLIKLKTSLLQQMFI